MEVATFAGGCFWGIEHHFKNTEGVRSAVSGYMGGDPKRASYEEVCKGDTGHAEAVRIVFDPNEITYKDLLKIFFRMHDPTTLNRQGPDIGSQYRSVIFYHSFEQKEIAEKLIQKLLTLKVFHSPIVTEVSHASVFFEAEQYHQKFFEKNPNRHICHVLRPESFLQGL